MTERKFTPPKPSNTGSAVQPPKRGTSVGTTGQLEERQTVISEQSTSCDDSDEGWGGGDPQVVSVVFTAEDVAAAVEAEREANLDILRTLISSAIAQEKMSYTERYREGCKMQQYAFDLAFMAIAARGDHS